MNSFNANVINETMKLFYRTKNRWLLLLSALIPILSAVLISRFQNGFGVAAVGSADFPVLMLQAFTVIFLPLFVFMAASDMFAGEIGDRSIKLLLTRPINRFKVFASKVATLCIYIIVFLVVAFASSMISGLFIKEKGDIWKGILHSVIAYGAAALPMIAIATVAVCVIQWFKNSTGALTVCILIYAMAKLTGFLFPQFTVYMPTAYTDWYMLWIGGNVASGKIVSIFMFLAACSILFFTAGYYQFDKKEL